VFFFFLFNIAIVYCVKDDAYAKEVHESGDSFGQNIDHKVFGYRCKKSTLMASIIQ